MTHLPGLLVKFFRVDRMGKRKEKEKEKKKRKREQEEESGVRKDKCAKGKG
jgi:hypothetical protein